MIKHSAVFELFYPYRRVEQAVSIRAPQKCESA